MMKIIKKENKMMEKDICNAMLIIQDPWLVRDIKGGEPIYAESIIIDVSENNSMTIEELVIKALELFKKNLILEK